MRSTPMISRDANRHAASARSTQARSVSDSEQAGGAATGSTLPGAVAQADAASAAQTIRIQRDLYILVADLSRRPPRPHEMDKRFSAPRSSANRLVGITISFRVGQCRHLSYFD